MSWLGEVRKMAEGERDKAYVCEEIAGTVARTGSRWRLKGGGWCRRPGADAAGRCEWPGGCLC